MVEKKPNSYAIINLVDVPDLHPSNYNIINDETSVQTEIYETFIVLNPYEKRLVQENREIRLSYKTNDGHRIIYKVMAYHNFADWLPSDKRKRLNISRNDDLYCFWLSIPVDDK